jgi:hypothetical protein
MNVLNFGVIQKRGIHMRRFKILWILSVFTLFILSFNSFGQEKAIEERYSCGPIKITIISKIEPVNSTKEILKNTFLMTEQTIIIDDKKIKVGPSLGEYNNKVPGGYLKNDDEKTKSLYERYKKPTLPNLWY